MKNIKKKQDYKEAAKININLMKSNHLPDFMDSLI